MKPENKVEEPAAAYGNITSLDQLDLSKRYSYADYFRWQFQDRVELIKGFIHKMSPAPAPSHQKVSLRLTLEFGNFFKQKTCKVFFAPFDVRLPDSKKQTDDPLVYTVVQPDLCIICDPDKIDDRGCIGSPDLVIEILSPGNTKKEMGVKFDLYEENGVKEYWLVEPSEKVIYVYILQNGKFIGLKPFTEDDDISPALFPELRFGVKEVFEIKTDTIIKSENKVEEPAAAYGNITSLDQLDLSKRYSYADYFRWKFLERVELIKGFIHKMSPAPAHIHQKVAKKLVLRIGNYFENKKCEMFFAPFDVRLPDSKKQTDDPLVYTVVQPDLCIICDPDKIDARGCIGAPDLVIEILSPGNTKKEMGVKFDLYEENGVKEYWLVEPSEKVIYVYILQNGKFIGLKPFTEDDDISPALFPELRFGVKEVFE